MMHSQSTPKLLNVIVVVAALGYFVDIYDLILFGIVKNPSLTDLGISGSEALFSKGNFLLNCQMAGMLLGGIFFGVMGDKRGRLSTLFVTISLYSLANIANGFVQNTAQYAILRFIAGFGLSGELGIGITLVSEVMSKQSRGMGASIVSGIGIAGAGLAYLVVEKFNWRVAYWTGGTLGLLLLFMRVAVYESGLYEKTKTQQIKKGRFLSLFTSNLRFRKFILCVLAGVPTWFAVSVLAINSTSFAELLHIEGIKGSTSVMLHYIGAALGSFIFGMISEKLRSRRKAILMAISLMTFFTLVYFLLDNSTQGMFYTTLFLLGIPMGGLWAVFITTTSEQFGTNLRATVTTSAPNFVRGATILITFLLALFSKWAGLYFSGIMVGILFLGAAFIAAFRLPETYGKELDYVEEI
jgi:MFS transporter, putative metabolite:H+ symporter